MSNDKALQAVKAMAAIIADMKITNEDEVTISRSEYESLCCNQCDHSADSLFIVPSIKLERYSDDNALYINDEKRKEILQVKACHPARAVVGYTFDKAGIDTHADDEFVDVVSHSHMDLHQYDRMYLDVPPSYSKEDVLRGLKTITDMVEHSWESSSAVGKKLASGYHNIRNASPHEIEHVYTADDVDDLPF